MSAFKISNIESFKNVHFDKVLSISYQLNSSDIPYDMRKNFMIMEKTPDYLFQYFNTLLDEKEPNGKSGMNMSIKSLDDYKTEITLNTNDIIFFDTIKKTLETFENHFLLVISDYSCFDSHEKFLEQTNKLNLFEKLDNILVETNNIVKKHKI